MQDLDTTIREKIDATFRVAKQNLRDGDIDSALVGATEAWAQLPEPKFDWDVSKSFVHAYATLYRDAGRYDEAVRLMEMLFASGTVKPHQDRPYFILGTIYYEMGRLEDARRWLGEANSISKGRCFKDELEKYKKALTK
jgi:tetratricopeptide (TPR) repeat protein